MPTNKKEDFYFGLMMCCGMVVIMTSYNLFTNGLIGSLSIGGILVQFVIGFIIAFLLESFVVGPVAKKMAFSLPYNKTKKVFVILSLSFFMVTGMVLCMSLYGTIMATLSNVLMEESFIEKYLSTVFKNYIFAFPLQLLIVGPLVRFIFTRFVQVKRGSESLS